MEHEALKFGTQVVLAVYYNMLKFEVTQMNTFEYFLADRAPWWYI